MDPVVLIVDDNEDNRFTLSMRLEACGYENIVTAENGREALEKMRSGPVDLVLLDIMMPELDGYGVLEELRTDTALRDVPVVMIMADPENGDAVAFLVTLREPADRTVRVNITLPERLLRRIDERAKNRSAFLARAAEKALAES